MDATTKPAEAKPKATASETAKTLLSNGLITPQSQDAVRSLHFLMNIGNYVNLLQYRIACTMAICNKLGIMAGQSGGGPDGKYSSPLEKTSDRYRRSAVPGTVPTTNLPSSLIALASQAQVNFAAPSSEDSTAYSEVRNVGYFPNPTGRSRAFYKTLNGPPLAPQGEQSRVVTNYVVAIDPEGETGFSAQGKWSNVKEVGKYGEENILNRHFELGVGGKTKKIKRDLRGATQYEDDQIKRQIQIWVMETARDLV